MSTPVTFNTVTYNVPAVGETGWGSQVSSLLIALATYAQTNNIQKMARRIATTSTVTVSATTDALVGINHAGAVAVSLPAGVAGQLFYIKDVSGAASTNNITITPNGAETINGASTYVINTDRAGIGIVFNGSNWDIVAESVGAKLLRSRIAAGTANHVLINDGSGNLSSEAQLAVSRGGTNSGAALNNNRVMQSSSGAIVEAAAITASRALISDANGIPTHSATTSTELGYVSGVTNAIQTQLDAKATTTLNNLGVTSINADLIPASNNAVDIGSASLNFQDIHTRTTKLYGSTSGLVTLQAPATVTSYSLTLPDNDGTSGDVLTTDGSGVTTWTTPGSITTGQQSFSGLKKFEGGLIDVGYVGTNPEAGGSSPFTMTNAHRRTMVINPASDITLLLPTTSVKAGEVYTIVNQAAYWATIQSSAGNTITKMIAGTVRLVPLIDTPTANTDWIVIDAQGRLIDAGNIPIKGVSADPTKGTMQADKWWYGRMGEFLIVRGRYAQSTAGSAGSGLYYIDLPASLTINDQLSSASTSNVSWNDCYGLFRATTDYTLNFGNSDTNMRYGSISNYDTGRIKFGLRSSATNGDYGLGSDGGGFSFSGSSMGFWFEGRIPITQFKIG